MMDLTQNEMGLLGGLSALGVFGIFIGTWWWYAMRVHEARALVASGRAILVDVDEPEEFAAQPISGARNIPLDALYERAGELGSHRRPIVVCGHSTFGPLIASRRLRRMGYRVAYAGPMGGV